MVKPGVVFIPCPAMGHFISAVEFAKKLESRFAVTILQIAHSPPAWSSAIKAYVESVVSSGFDIRFEELPHIVPPHAEKQRPETFASRLMEVNKSPARDAISLIPNNNIAAIILDLFGSSMVDVADELGIPAYIYFTSNAALLGSMLYLPTLHVKVPCELMEFGGHISMPGLPPVPSHCMPSFAMDKKDEAYTTFINHGLCFRKAKGLIINTFEDIEPKTLQALADGEYLPDHTMPPVFPVGPVLAIKPKRDQPHDCIAWLDKQPVASVVFLCFGSMGCFEAPQVKEVAVGLERSGHRFLWALRSPNTTDSFRFPTDSDLDEVLPEGFLERTEGRGLVLPSWVPQTEILSHEAVGGFVTHCGWNSVLEAVWLGVPMLGWPLFGDQHLNCLAMVKQSGVALELKLDYNNGGFVSSGELEKGVRSLMGDIQDSRNVRGKVKQMKVDSRRTVMEGGSSNVALEQLICELNKKVAVAVTVDKHNSCYVTPTKVVAT